PPSVITSWARSSQAAAAVRCSSSESRASLHLRRATWNHSTRACAGRQGRASNVRLSSERTDARRRRTDLKGRIECTALIHALCGRHTSADSVLRTTPSPLLAPHVSLWCQDLAITWHKGSWQGTYRDPEGPECLAAREGPKPRFPAVAPAIHCPLAWRGRLIEEANRLS